MLRGLKITKTRPGERTLDYAFLRSEGLKYIEQLSSRIWTDYNIHDPGVTIIELLCYAITDLGYRTSFPVKDILAEGGGGKFLTAAEILPTRPVTVNDYRKLLIDIDGIKNAWLRVHTGTEYHLVCPEGGLSHKPPPSGVPSRKITPGGLYDVIIDIDAEEAGTGDESAVKAAALRRLHENRNLCEDFVEIKTVREQEFIICTEVDLDADADVDLTQARIFHEVQRYLTPSVRFRSLREMLDRGKGTDEIFSGPLLENGFIDDEELEEASLRECIHLSDVIRVIMAVDGVRAVRDIKISPAGGILDDESKWAVTVEKDHKPVLDREASRIVFYKGHLPFRADKDRVSSLLEGLRAQEAAKQSAVKTEDLPVPSGRVRNIKNYYSFQNHFPRNYGIGEAGLPDSASNERKAQAKQLKAYLLFFDQLLADYLAQLANAGRLFSTDEDIDRTYFTQVVDSVRDVEELYGIDHADIGSTIQALAEDEELFIKRRNRFLDHLLARFAESFSEYAWIMYTHGHDMNSKDLIRTKTAFLDQYAGISSGRGRAFDYTRSGEVWDTYNVSGLEQRVAHLLGIRNYKRRNLYNIKYEVYQEADSDGVDEYRFRVVDDGGKILLSSSTRYATGEDAVREMRRALGLAMTRKGYELKETSDGRYYFNITDETGEVLARRIEYFETEQKREEAVRYLMDFLAERYSDEGFFVVEHILLRPKGPADGFLPVCVGADCTDGEYADPYSFRISIILPAWTSRFSDTDFRRFVEKTIRAETPAHILPRICWVNEEQMAEFEEAYREWLEFNASGAKDGNALNRLIDVLSRLKSVYPEAVLTGCTDGMTGERTFILDKSNLGTRKE
ncbi:MAG: diguanylate cyclase [Nitrospirae bacterium]|nr:diguanylate cyclase [Nitrospirota bacterium]